ncbi:MAG: DUF4410 domain-containing protein [Deltaproteobacteria bacterium]|jgi:hypothetical protein|nr:DUF4410 domain-containing protein [Deltaproteobacteria bacterium]
MKSCNKIGLYLVALLVIAGCASTKVTSRDEAVVGKLPRPNTIWVYDFAATPTDVPGESALAGQHSEHNPPQTAEQIKTGRQLGTEIEAELVKLIRGMGMPAEHAEAGAKPQINDLVLRGYLVSFNKGSEAKRIFIGFGSGASDLKVAVEGFQMTAQGLRKVGSGTTDSEGGKTPGADLGALSLIATHNPVGLIVSSGLKIYEEESGKSKVTGRAEQTAKEIADVLKKRFQQEGWID